MRDADNTELLARIVELEKEIVEARNKIASVFRHSKGKSKHIAELTRRLDLAVGALSQIGSYREGKHSHQMDADEIADDVLRRIERLKSSTK